MTADNGQLKDSQNLASTQQIYTDPSSVQEQLNTKSYLLVAALFVTNELIDLPTKPLIEVIDHSNCTRELNKLMHLYHAVLLCHFVYYHFIINTIAWKLKS
ncbi:hypothetical protein EB796_018608 [Bugula neritina]|uniref:Uncharacterized protein n=1 Tax=Bugula neritina TaxID=10212 RepID=A0A7J7JA19_BUGNE|nr:hypothetical protein EB796_018608 [Bugula neritina]